MTINPNNVTHGTVGGTSIVVDISRFESSAPVHVQLTANYTVAETPGLPRRPQFTGASQANLEYPRTIPSGTKLYLFAGEANALIQAGAASLLSSEKGAAAEAQSAESGAIEEPAPTSEPPIVRKKTRFPKSDQTP